jgi:hypothetical protein
VLVLAVSILTGCDSNDDSLTPTFLPSTAFTIRTELFENPPSQPGSHFQAAAKRILPVADPVNAEMAIPFAMALAAPSVEPEVTGEIWSWATSIMGTEEMVQASLEATQAADNVFDWSLKLTGADGADDFDNFEALIARTTASSALGSWERFHTVGGERRSSLAAQFGVQGLESFMAMTIRDSLSAVVAAGDSLDYARSTGDFHRFFWLDLSAAEAFLIQWNTTTKEGGVRASDYNDAIDSCWDSQLADTPC